MPGRINDKDIPNEYNKGLINKVLSNIKEFVIKVRLRLEYPSKTMLFEVIQSETWWHIVDIWGIPIMQVVCRCEIVNITKNIDVRPITVILKKSKTYGIVSVFSENGAIDANWGLKTSFEFLIRKPFVRSGQSFLSDIIVYDQFNNKHIIKKVKFEYR